MKASVILLCLLLAFPVICEICLENCKPGEDDERHLVVNALIGVLTDHFVKVRNKMAIMFVGLPGGLAETIMNEMMPRLPFGLSVELSTDMAVINSKGATIFIFDSVQYMEPLEERWTNEELVDYEGFWFSHLLYAPELTVKEIAKIFKENTAISEVGFLVNYDGSSIELATSFLFTPGKCHENQIKAINRFSRNTNRWENSTFYPDKFRNFHGCPVSVTYDKDKERNNIARRIFETLEKELNFTMKRIGVNNVEYSALMNGVNITETIIMQEAADAEFTYSSAIYVDTLTFAIPPGLPLTDLERMFAAFDNDSWTGIVITFVIAVSMILLINFMPARIREFFYGQNIRTPMLNLIDIFINGGQNREPNRNFSRFLLMLFVIWSLIIRTCYQSMAFENLNSDMRHDKISSVEELKEGNYTMYHNHDTDLFPETYSNK
jgi:hypothetical protein